MVLPLQELSIKAYRQKFIGGRANSITRGKIYTARGYRKAALSDAKGQQGYFVTFRSARKKPMETLPMTNRILCRYGRSGIMKGYGSARTACFLNGGTTEKKKHNSASDQKHPSVNNNSRCRPDSGLEPTISLVHAKRKGCTRQMGEKTRSVLFFEQNQTNYWWVLASIPPSYKIRGPENRPGT